VQLRRQLDNLKLQYEAARESKNAAEALAEDLKNSVAAGVTTEVDYLNALTNCAAAQLKTEQFVMMQKITQVQLSFAEGRDIIF
jgi:outer membrane protein TolC